MNRREISANIDAFLRLQALCLGIILASWLIFWAVENPVNNIRDLFLYVLTQVNLTVVLLHPLKFLYQDRSSRYHWPVHVISILAVNCVVVITSAVVIYGVHHWNLPFTDFLRRSWKFPFVANLVFAFAYEAYKVTTRRLRRHNQQLQKEIDVEAAERKVEAEELEQALEIQRGLLPKEIPQLPAFEIAGAWEPAKIVGGDYYDVIRIARNKVAICIADVAGKGVSAALLMANVQAAVRAFASDYATPAQVCAQINSVLFNNTAPEKFVTLFYGVLDARTRSLQYANAGHPRPLLVRGNGSVTRLENSGALLGVFPNWKYEDSTLELQPGDLLMLFTDGITEAMAPGGEEFGEERVIAAIAGVENRSLAGLETSLMSDIKTFCSSRLTDDATLVIVSAGVEAREQQGSVLNRNHTDQHAEQYAGVRS